MFCSGVMAQNTKEQIVAQVMEYLLETSEEELDFTDLQQDLLGHLQKPINLNNADFYELSRLGFITEPEILAIITHRNEYGNFLGTFELQAVEGLGSESARLLKYFVSCTEYLDNEKLTINKVLTGSGGDFIMRYRTILQDQEGYKLDSLGNKDYLGSQYQLFNRVSYRYKNKVSLGYTAEKDMGEQFFSGSQPAGFDYYSAHLYVSKIGKLQSLAIGDYQVQFGQGLTLWSGLSFGKSADAMNVVRRARKIRPYRSVNENQFLRGAAITLGKDKTQLSLLYSQKNVDGNLEEDTLNNEESYFTALQISGFHRTENEIADKNKIKEQIFGANIETKLKGITIGATHVQYNYSPTLQRNISPYQFYEFNGNNLNNTGVYFHGLIGRVYVFGESALSDFNKSTFSSINGAVLSLSNKIELATIYRYYAPQFNALYSGPFREQSRAKNEIGLYTGMHVKFNDALKLRLYLDRFRFPWLKFRTDLPSRGHEYLAELNYRPSRNFEMYGRIRTQIKEQNMPDNETALNILAAHNNTRYRFQFRYKINKEFIATSRIEYATYKLDNKTTAKGVLLFQDLAFKPLEKPYSILGRYAIFNVDDYVARIYSYENDVLYSYSIPAYQDQGIRFYILGRLKIKRKIDLWLRYSQTSYFNRNTIGSGNELISGNKRSEIKAQVRFKF
ncbi:MAG: ComEA family DNA-binding protein [Bacteroidia bacterium]